MSSSKVVTGEINRKEPIPGYKTLELLGRGGCGEVWKATAPGGLTKAVKIVYGDVDASHATMEMRALTRIKDVRHPLLMSIERIEDCGGTLVIVTELADCSLKQRFVALRDQGMVGIPQDELFGYVTDVAEALDYLYSAHSLQHLDVKPENILLVADRAKVGDFGLVKHLYDRAMSMIGGMTSTYAPPEMFEGKPSRFSDQYSLAITYMHMLTGVLPFSASSAAQIAAQHVSGVPDLSALPRRQQNVIARALSKDPNLRFASCKTMVKALRESLEQSEAKRTNSEQTDHPEPSNFGSHPDRRQIPTTHPVAESKSTWRESAQPDTESHATRDAGPVSASQVSVGGKGPSLVIGIGGAGVAVIARQVERLRNEYGNVSKWPPVEFVVLDTNARELSATFSEDVLDRVSVVPIPLLTAESYGLQANKYLAWLNRRWLYNIPRDLSTDGFRPLGRLALKTHAARVKQEIESAIARVESHNPSSQKTDGSGSPLNSAPQVILVGSISGGTASGSIIDLAYAVRSALKRHGLSDEHVHGVLLHSTPRSNAERDKSRASAYSFLAELFHFSRPGGHFPADAVLGITPFHGDNSTFRQTHYFNLGDSLGTSEWDLAMEQMADFVYCASVTAASQWLESSEVPDPTHIRNYHVLALGSGLRSLLDFFSKQARNDVRQLWLHGQQEAFNSKAPISTERCSVSTALAAVSSKHGEQLDGPVSTKLNELRITHEQILKEAKEVVLLECGGEIEKYQKELTNELLDVTRKNYEGTARLDVVLNMINELMYREGEVEDEDGTRQTLHERIAARLKVRIRRVVDSLTEWIHSLVDDRTARIEGARKRAVVVRATLQSILSRFVKIVVETSESAIELGIRIRNIDTQEVPQRFSVLSFRKKDPDDKYRPDINTYAQKKLDEAMYRAIVKMVRIMDTEVAAQIEHLNRLARDVNCLPEFGGDCVINLPDENDCLGNNAAAICAFQREMLRRLELRRGEIAAGIEAQVDDALQKSGSGMRQFVDPDAKLAQTIERPLLEKSRKICLDFIKQTSVQILEQCMSSDELLGNVNLFDMASGSGRSSGSSECEKQQQYLVVPESLDKARFPAEVNNETHQLTIVLAKKSDITICTVLPESTMVEIGNEVISGVPVYRELASKLHVRSDVAWSSFTHAKSPTTAVPLEAAETFETAVIVR